MVPTDAGIAIVAAWIVLIWVSRSLICGQFHYFVLMWAAVYPFCYYFLSFPKEQSIFTVDRALIGLLLIEMVVASRQNSAVPVLRDVRISAYLWGLYLLTCCLSLVGHPPSLLSYRMLVDGMVLPAVFGFYAMRYFPLLQDIRKLHACVCILAVGLCITGVIELTTGVDLLPWNGAHPQFTDTHVRRADGPFEQPGILSVVAILVFFLISYLRRLMPKKVSPGRALLHKVGFFCSFIAALAPLNRGLIIILVPVALIDCLSRNRLVSRKTWGAIFGCILFIAFTAKVFYPVLFDDRTTRPDNVYQRLAQDQETLRVVRQHPLFGVGFNLYNDAASQDPRFLVSWNGVVSMNLPHNSPMTVLSEEGVIGLLFYTLAQIFLIRAMWKVRKVYPLGWLAFLYCVIVYGLTGLDFAMVYYSDANLFYMFTLGIFFQMQLRILRENKTSILKPEISRNEMECAV